MSRLTGEQLKALVAIGQSDGVEAAIKACEKMLNDNLAVEVLERGGSATLQLNEDPLALPRMKFVTPEEAHPVAIARIDWPARMVIAKSAKAG